MAGHASIGMAQSAGTFIVTGKMTTARLGHSATLLDDGKVLIAGGYGSVNGRLFNLASAELYDPSTETFTAIGDMSTVHGPNVARLLPNGNALIAGLGNADLYDPSAGNFNAINWDGGSLAGVLLDGRILVLLQGRLELSAPSTGSFTALPGVAGGLSGHKATVLNNGKVLFLPAGDVDDRTAELYDPDTGALNPVDWRDVNMTASTASLLPNGKVLVTLSPQETCGIDTEVYDPGDRRFQSHWEQALQRVLADQHHVLGRICLPSRRLWQRPRPDLRSGH
jgi:hypothetical protein